MRVMLLSANSLDPTGEAQYFRHLNAGMRDLSKSGSIEVQAYALNGRGKPLKYDVRPHPEERIEYLSFKKVVETAKDFDYVIISTARFGGDYNWLRDMETPYGLVIHSLPSIEQHKMAEIWSLPNKPVINYVLDKSIKNKAVEFGAEEFFRYVGLPFSPSLMEDGYGDVVFPRLAKSDDEPPYVIVPARIHFVKYPGKVAEMLVEAHESIPDLVGVFFGAEDFFYYNSLKDAVEANADFLTRVDPYLNEQDKAKWWSWATLAVDGTRLPKPPMRMQYTMLEAGHFGVPILVDEQRHNMLWGHGVQSLPLNPENIVKVLQDAELRQNMAVANMAYVKSMHVASGVALEMLAPFVYDWIGDGDAKEV